MKKAPIILLLVLGAAFVFALVRLYTLRFETGDVYPAYSSLRADPLGVKAFYEGVNRFVPSARNYRPLSRFDAGPDTTVFFLGVSAADLEFMRPDFERLETFVGRGGRLVMAFAPVVRPPRPRLFTRTPPARIKKADDDDTETDEPPVVSLTNRWDVTFAYASPDLGANGVLQPVTASLRKDSPLPGELAVHTTLWFAGASNGWRVIYARTNDLAVLVERRMGRGTVVLCADAYPFSNEALLEEREPELLAWLIGPARRVVFDEAHLGVQEDPGVATLARRYRLHGVFAALLVLAGLYVWKNSVSFLPPLAGRDQTDGREVVLGRDSAAGFVNLLRRSIPRDQILKVCVEQWNADCAQTARPSFDRLERMQSVIDAENALPPRQRNPVATYRQFAAILSKRSGLRGRSAGSTRDDAIPREKP